MHFYPKKFTIVAVIIDMGTGMDYTPLEEKIRAAGIDAVGHGANLSIDGVHARSDSFRETNGTWEYVETYNVDMNPLYSMGYSRVGCVGCPMATAKTREKEFQDFPQYKDNYIKAFDRMIKNRKESGLSCEWKDGADCFEWWLYGNEKKEEKAIEGQETLF